MGIFAPMMAELNRKSDVFEMGKLYKLIVRWIISLSIPIAIIMILFSKKIMLLFGGNYVAASNALAILTLAAFIQTIFGGGGHTLTMTGFTKINMVNSIIAVLINIVLNITWIPLYGIMGAAYATLVSMAALGGLRLVEVQHYVKINPFSLKLLKPIIAGGGMFIILKMVKPTIMPMHTILSLLIVTAIGFLSFYLILWLLKFDDDDKEVWSGIRMITNKK
jgi:O-antigen/teichoic acid export membrane protein|tara:strand:- start:776 stop:1438 length:663 start_codon:yes stop_codon:yes gene_type:complete